MLFEPEFGIGTQVSDRLSIEASWVHMSHAQMFGRQNPGIDNIGMRLNFKLLMVAAKGSASAVPGAAVEAERTHHRCRPRAPRSSVILVLLDLAGIGRAYAGEDLADADRPALARPVGSGGGEAAVLGRAHAVSMVPDAQSYSIVPSPPSSSRLICGPPHWPDR